MTDTLTSKDPSAMEAARDLKFAMRADLTDAQADVTAYIRHGFAEGWKARDTEAADARAEVERLKAAIREYFDAEYDARPFGLAITDLARAERLDAAESTLHALMKETGQ